MLKKILAQKIAFYYLLFIYVSFFILIQILQALIGEQLTNYPLLFVVLILINLIIVFLMSGFYAIVYLKLSSNKITIFKFIQYGFNNYYEFLKIGILIASIVYLINFFITKIIFEYIAVNITSVAIFNFFSFAFSKIVSFFVNVLFVFSYPIVIINYFSKKDLNPIRTSFCIVFNEIKKIRFVIFLLSINLVISLICRWMISSELIFYRNIIISLLTSIFSYVILIYSFLILLDGNLSSLEEIKKGNKGVKVTKGNKGVKPPLLTGG